VGATDLEMLEALCASDRLNDYEREAFGGMLGRLRHNAKKITESQREWVEARYLAYDLDADEPALNLVSSGKVAKTSLVMPYELLPRPEKPPGKK
jgi:hypothetical protein